MHDKQEESVAVAVAGLQVAYILHTTARFQCALCSTWVVLLGTILKEVFAQNIAEAAARSASKADVSTNKCHMLKQHTRLYQ